MDSHQIPENCLEIKAPLLNKEIVEKGNLDRASRKLDSTLLNIQQLIVKATAALVNATDKLHSVTTALADPSHACSRETCVLWKRPMKHCSQQLCYRSAWHSSARTVLSQEIPATTSPAQRHGVHMQQCQYHSH